MPHALSVIIVDNDRRARHVIEELLKPFGHRVAIAGSFATFQEVLQCGAKPEIVILEASELEKGIEEVRTLHSTFPGINVFITASEKNPDWILKLIRAGASEYLIKPIVAGELVEAVKKVGQLHTQRSGESRAAGKVISLYNPSGGMGTTTIAVNLAAALAAKGDKVLLVDLNQNSSDVSTFLDLTPRYTIDSIMGNMTRVDSTYLMNVLARHDCGIHVLGGSEDIAERLEIRPDHIREILALSRSMFAYTIIDTGGPLAGINQATFACSDQILFNTVLNLATLKNSRRYLPVMASQGFAGSRLKIVVNRHAPKDDIRIADAEKVLSSKVFMTIPNAFADVNASINKGEPVVACFPKSPVSKAIEELARQVTAN